MDSNYEREYLVAEQTHPWFVYRRKLIWNLIKNTKKDAKILEIGCGSGINLQMLKKKGFRKLTGIEPSSKMKKKYKNIKIISSLDKIKGKFDLILLLDVLEHVKNDSALLKRLENLLEKRGRMLITVPAFKLLWSYHDIINHHFRRYTKKSLKQKLKNTSLRIKRMFYWNLFLFLPIATNRLLKKQKKTKKSDIASLSFLFSKIYSILLSLENRIIKLGINPPFGVSLVAVTKK